MIGSDAWGLAPYDFTQGAPASFAWAPLKLAGATGWPGNPVAAY
jgi:hypothetical protein